MTPGLSSLCSQFDITKAPAWWSYNPTLALFQAHGTAKEDVIQNHDYALGCRGSK